MTEPDLQLHQHVPATNPDADRFHGRVWIASGLALAAVLAALLVFVRHWPLWPRHTWPRAGFTALYGVAMAAFLAGASIAGRIRMTARRTVVLVGVAAAIRAMMWASPVLRDEDYHRYMWDGALTARGISPYRYSPQEVRDGQVDEPRIVALAREAGGTLQRVNHPALRTIYPPLAQGLFAVAHWIAPFDRAGLLLVLAGLDALTAVALWGMLRAWGRSAGWLVLYLWNPLIPVEVYYCLHYDLALCLPVLGLIWALWRGRAAAAGAALAVGVGLKVWPVVLAPLVLVRFRRSWRQIATAGGVFVLLTAALCTPFVGALSRPASSGPLQYAARWEVNAFVYKALHYVGLWAWRLVGEPGFRGELVGRGLLLIVLLTAAWRRGLRTQYDRPGEIARSAGLLCLLMLLLSPAIYPWYALALVAASVLAPAPTYLFWWVALALMNVPDAAPARWAVVGLLHLPVWWWAVRERRRPPGPREPMPSALNV